MYFLVLADAGIFYRNEILKRWETLNHNETRFIDLDTNLVTHIQVRIVGKNHLGSSIAEKTYKVCNFRKFPVTYLRHYY